MKSESDRRQVFVLVDFLSLQERVLGGIGDKKRWQIESLVINVPRHLQVVKAFTLTSRPTVARGTIVHSATSHLGELIV